MQLSKTLGIFRDQFYVIDTCGKEHAFDNFPVMEKVEMLADRTKLVLDTHCENLLKNDGYMEVETMRLEHLSFTELYLMATSIVSDGAKMDDILDAFEGFEKIEDRIQARNMKGGC